MRNLKACLTYFYLDFGFPSGSSVCDGRPGSHLYPWLSSARKPSTFRWPRSSVMRLPGEQPPSQSCAGPRAVPATNKAKSHIFRCQDCVLLFIGELPDAEAVRSCNYQCLWICVGVWSLSLATLAMVTTHNCSAGVRDLEKINQSHNGFIWADSYYVCRPLHTTQPCWPTTGCLPHPPWAFCLASTYTYL